MKCNMGEYHPHFDTTPDFLNIAATARGVRGTTATAFSKLHGSVYQTGFFMPES